MSRVPATPKSSVGTRPDKRLEFVGRLVVEHVRPVLPGAVASTDSKSAAGDRQRPITIDVSTSPDDRIVVDLSHFPSRQGWGPLSKLVWLNRSNLAAIFAALGQPLRLRVGGETWADVEVAPSRLGRLFGTPQLSFRLTTNTILPQWLRNRRFPRSS